MRITLTVTEGPHQGRAFRFAVHSTFLVGRSPDVHFVLSDNDPYFSRIHFMIEVNPPLCRLLDMGSHNGTYVNGERIKSADLKGGDRIQAGHTVMTVALEQAESAPTSTRPENTLSMPPLEQSTPSIATQTMPPTGTGELQSPPTIRPSDPTVKSDMPTMAEVPGFVLERELGRGGMGVVYLARTLADGSLLAVKMIIPAVMPNPMALVRFLREVEILQQLKHRHIVTLRASGEVSGRLYFAMDYVPGTDAAQLVQREGPMPVGRAMRLICQLCDALAYAHSQGFVHRDVKPGNLLVTTTSGEEEVRLTDFGLARTYQSSQLSGLTMVGSSGGTPSFMPPEQILNFREVKPAADQYATAMTLYHLLTGRHAYDRSDSVQEVFRRILQTDPIPIRSVRPDLPEALAPVIHRGLLRRPEDRYPDIQQFSQALRAIALG